MTSNSTPGTPPPAPHPIGGDALVDHGTTQLEWPTVAGVRPATTGTTAPRPDPLPIREFVEEEPLLLAEFPAQVGEEFPASAAGFQPPLGGLVQPAEVAPPQLFPPQPKSSLAGSAAPLILPASAFLLDELSGWPTFETTGSETGGSTSAVALGDDVARPSESTSRRGLLWRVGGAIAGLLTCLFGLTCVLVLLAVVAAIPVVNFWALGYLLEAEGNVARTGRLRDGFPLLRFAPRLGTIGLGLWLWLLPLRLLGDLATDARLIAPGSPPERLMQGLRWIAVVAVTLHLLLALARGGTWGCFFRPLKNLRFFSQNWSRDEYWQEMEQAIAAYVAALQPKRRFVIGMKGFGGALAWLFLPTLLLASATRSEGPPVLLALIGGLLLVPVLMWVPFLQAHFACEQRWGALFELRAVRQLYRHAPFSWLVALLVTLGFALPLYLFKAALPPRDALWPITLLYVLSIYPARLIAGWAYHRARQRSRSSFWLWRWTCWLPTLPVVLLYVFLLYFTQFIGKYGKLTLFEHHAFLVPSPYSFLN